jgi:hypothetical protein
VQHRCGESVVVKRRCGKAFRDAFVELGDGEGFAVGFGSLDSEACFGVVDLNTCTRTHLASLSVLWFTNNEDDETNVYLKSSQPNPSLERRRIPRRLLHPFTLVGAGSFIP